MSTTVQDRTFQRAAGIEEQGRKVIWQVLGVVLRYFSCYVTDIWSMR